MKKFGMVIASGSELSGVLNAFGKVGKSTSGPFPVYKVGRDNAEIFVAASGVGQIAAAAATQYLISEYKVEAVLNFGFVGSLTSNLKCLDIVLVKDLVHYEFDTSLIDGCEVGRYLDYPAVEIPLSFTLLTKTEADFPDIKSVRLASGDKFIASAEKKEWLIKSFGAEICDMECAGIVLTAARNGIPVLSVKVISDNADETSPKSFTEIAEQGTAECAKILTDIVDKLSK